MGAQGPIPKMFLKICLIIHSLRVGWRNHGILKNYWSKLLVLFFCFVFYVKFNTTLYVCTYGGTTCIYGLTDSRTDGRMNKSGGGWVTYGSSRLKWWLLSQTACLPGGTVGYPAPPRYTCCAWAGGTTEFSRIIDRICWSCFFCFVFYVKFNTTLYVRTYGGTTRIYGLTDSRTQGQTDRRTN